ncbi:hypothetical protein BC833DRAFT_590747 [Globomyces pollinis-pini]|nr:hypothetical protein BC833DRAFT_590747 [Globomyces pollinis-pini]
MHISDYLPSKHQLRTVVLVCNWLSVLLGICSSCILLLNNTKSVFIYPTLSICFLLLMLDHTSFFKDSMADKYINNFIARTLASCIFLFNIYYAKSSSIILIIFEIVLICSIIINVILACTNLIQFPKKDRFVQGKNTDPFFAEIPTVYVKSPVLVKNEREWDRLMFDTK